MNTTTMQAVFGHMTPTTVAAMIADLDEGMADELSSDEMYVMQFAIDTLFGLVGPQEAIDMLADLEVTAANPLVADAVDEWTEV